MGQQAVCDNSLRLSRSWPLPFLRKAQRAKIGIKKGKSFDDAKLKIPKKLRGNTGPNQDLPEKKRRRLNS